MSGCNRARPEPGDGSAENPYRFIRDEFEVLRGLRVPADLVVMGFDDREFASYIGLTTIRQPLFDSGRIALKLLLDRLLDDSPIVPQAVQVQLPVALVPRDTA